MQNVAINALCRRPMSQLMPEAPPSQQETDIISIDTIKKAFIEQHQRPAANQSRSDASASAERIEAIKRAIAPLEHAFNTPVKVAARAMDDCPRQGSIQIHQDQAILLANGIYNDLQAHNQFYLAVVGYLAVPHYLAKKGQKTIKQVYQSLSQEQKSLIESLHSINDAQKESDIVGHYLAQLASMNLSLNFLSRRDSFQRSILRLFIPKLKWSNQDLHYLILQAKKKWIKKEK